MLWRDQDFVAADFETSGKLPEYALQPWRIPKGDAWATSLVWLRKGKARFDVQGKLFPPVDELRRCLQEAIDRKQTIVCWNAVFDIAVFLAHGLDDLVFRVKWLDGMLVWRHLYIEPEYEMTAPKKKSYGLKTAVAEFLPEFAGYEDEIDYHSTDPADLKKLHDYNVRDNVFTLRITKHLYQLLQQNPQRLKAMLIEQDCLPMVAQANLRGMLIDTLWAKHLQARLVQDADEALTLLAPVGVTEKIVRSPIQMAKLLFDQWRLPVLKENTSKLTGKTTRSTDKEVLHELAFIDPRAKVLREYREALNNKTKFADAPLASVVYNEDGHSHPQAIVFGTYSGRLTYASKQGKNKDTRQTGFALHQEKRGADFRGIVTSPPGYTLMEFDASGQEFRWMAIASGDEVMLGLCAPGEDAHTYMGARINERDYREMMRLVKEGDKASKDGRQLGKVGNLSLQYRTSYKKLRVVARVQYNLPMTLPEAQFIWKTYQKTYPGVPKYWGRQIFETRHSGYVETFAGRRVQVVGNWEGVNGWSMASTSINYRIQGTGADQKYLAMSVLRPYLRSIGAYFAWDLHDGIYLWVPDNMVAKAAVDIRHLLNNLPYQKAWGFTPPIELPWDCKVGGSWGSLKEYQYA